MQKLEKVVPPASAAAAGIGPCWVAGKEGSVPSGAVEACHTTLWKDEFVARVRHDGLTLPATLIPPFRHSFTLHKGTQLRKPTYEVLCHAETTWEMFEQSGSSAIPEDALAIGYTETEGVLYLGRTHANGTMLVGKVSSRSRKLVIFYNLKIQKIYSKFELLRAPQHVRAALSHLNRPADGGMKVPGNLSKSALRAPESAAASQMVGPEEAVSTNEQKPTIAEGDEVLRNLLTVLRNLELNDNGNGSQGVVSSGAGQGGDENLSRVLTMARLQQGGDTLIHKLKIELTHGNLARKFDQVFREERLEWIEFDGNTTLFLPRNAVVLDLTLTGTPIFLGQVKVNTGSVSQLELGWVSHRLPYACMLVAFDCSRPVSHTTVSKFNLLVQKSDPESRVMRTTQHIESRRIRELCTALELVRNFTDEKPTVPGDRTLYLKLGSGADTVYLHVTEHHPSPTAPIPLMEQEEGLRLIELPVDDDEYISVSILMHSTITMHSGGTPTGYNIHKIQRVENAKLSRRFNQAREWVALDNGGHTNERSLFHGSHKCQEIVQSGFDEQHASVGGMFGAGIYFSEFSSKSNLYALDGLHGKCALHNSATCTTCPRQMLQCRVLLGKIAKLTAASNWLAHGPPGYHSVEGRVRIGGSNKLSDPEYIVYRGDRALPQFLITYTPQ